MKYQLFLTTTQIQKLDLICFANPKFEHTETRLSSLSMILVIALALLVSLTCLILLYRLKIFHDEKRMQTRSHNSPDGTEITESRNAL